MIVKINKWVYTGGEYRSPKGFAYGEMRLEKGILDTDLVEVFNAKPVQRVYDFPYDVVRIPYRRLNGGSFETDSESYRKLVEAMGREIVEI